MTSPFSPLQDLLGERLLLPENHGFGSASAVTFAGAPRIPAAIARPRSATEISKIVKMATEAGLALTVRSGGHSSTRGSLREDALILDMRLMNDYRVDPDRMVATSQGGISAGEYTRRAAEDEFVTGLGDAPSVGVAGLTLGGGIGYLSRRDGLTIDNLVSTEVVLADGEVVTASEQAHSDLFWALRGGGGNFGVVTALSLRLRHLTAVTGGMLAFRADAEVLESLVEAALHAPDSVSAMVNVMMAPPASFLPEKLHGTPIVAALLCHSGDPDDSAALLAPYRAAGVPVVDTVRLQRYSEMFTTSPDLTGLHSQAYSGFRDAVSTSWADDLIDTVRHAPFRAVANLRVMGGAVARVAPDATAFAHRERPIMATINALSPTPHENMRDWVDDTGRRLDLGESGYVNFISNPRAATTAYPPATLRRLLSVKDAYDPNDMFQASVPLTR